ncbi:WD repeat domain-containing protein 83 isoform X1 [Dromiciops gliroides]|uniref:WD repeat domain-containing protein 83 isoform X1 n=1 Tax=Dromiciops gliroides TaxID=33562 RepID=UPI001CC5DCE9|nr:WD repeat domain-containing protein 83 isoform X1 [Dromiciops gliroides]
MAFPEPRPTKPELPRKSVRSLPCRQGAVRAVRFNVDGRYCLTCGSDKSLSLWSPLRGTLLRTYSGHGAEVLDAAGSFDNSRLCSGGSDRAVLFWDVASGQILRKFRGHAGKVNCVQFNEEATVIVSGSIDSSVRCWDCRSRRPDPVQILDEAKDGISSIKLSDHEILAGSVDGRSRRYDLRMGELAADYVGSEYGHKGLGRAQLRTLMLEPTPLQVPSLVCALAKMASAHSSPALTPPFDSWIKTQGSCLERASLMFPHPRYMGHKNREYKLDCCLSERDTHVVSASEDGSVYFWDLVEGTLALTLPVGRGVVQSLAFHPTEPCLLTASEGTVQCWREESFVAEDDLPA